MCKLGISSDERTTVPFRTVRCSVCDVSAGRKSSLRFMTPNLRCQAIEVVCMNATQPLAQLYHQPSGVQARLYAVVCQLIMASSSHLERTTYQNKGIASDALYPLGIPRIARSDVRWVRSMTRTNFCGAEATQCRSQVHCACHRLGVVCNCQINAGG